MADAATHAIPGAPDNPFTSAAIALQRRPPLAMARMVSLALCAMAGLALVYAWFAPMDIVISAQGRVIPSGKSKVVQPLEAGIVRAIHVRDGAAVKAGDVLLEMDHTTTSADRERLQRDVWEAETETERLGAMARGAGRFTVPAGVPAEIVVNQTAILDSRVSEHRFRTASLEADIARRQADHDAIAASLVQLSASLPLVRKKHAMREELAKTGHIAETGLIETQLELINLEKELSVQQNRLKEAEAGLRVAAQQKAQADAEFRVRVAAELTEASRKRDSARQELIKASQRQELQVLRAPIDGVVQQLAVSTVGGVVTQAQPLMMIVPGNAALEVEAQVMNRDIGHLRAGQAVIVKVETFDFTRYGPIEGVVQWVGTDSVADPRLGPVYPVRVQLKTGETPFAINGRTGLVSPGMSVTADIRVDQRRLLEYFLAPLLRYKEESLRER
jgi:hemolysin D